MRRLATLRLPAAILLCVLLSGCAGSNRTLTSSTSVTAQSQHTGEDVVQYYRHMRAQAYGLGMMESFSSAETLSSEQMLLFAFSTRLGDGIEAAAAGEMTEAELEVYQSPQPKEEIDAICLQAFGRTPDLSAAGSFSYDPDSGLITANSAWDILWTPRLVLCYLEQQPDGSYYAQFRRYELPPDSHGQFDDESILAEGADVAPYYTGTAALEFILQEEPFQMQYLSYEFDCSESSAS